MTGAIRRVAWTRQYHNVSYATFLSASSSDFQKRDRERRTYQFERSSQYVSTSRTKRGESKSSSAAPHAPITCWVRARIHRSSGRAFVARGPADSVSNRGVKPSMFA